MTAAPLQQQAQQQEHVQRSKRVYIKIPRRSTLALVVACLASNYQAMTAPEVMLLGATTVAAGLSYHIIMERTIAMEQELTGLQEKNRAMRLEMERVLSQHQRRA